MKQANVQEYLVPENLEEVLTIISENKKKLGIVAGATDVYVGENKEIEVFLDITNIGLSYIEKREDLIAIGACTTFSDIMGSEFIKEEAACLWEAAGQLADKTIRNVATIGGNICNAVPSGDSISPLLALDAEFVIVSKGGERKINAEDFFVGVRKTKLNSDEILKEIIIPAKKGKQNSAFMKQGRNSEDIAIINVAVRLTLDKDDQVEDIRIANGAVAPTVVRALKLEQALVGKQISEDMIESNLEKLEESISPITNIRGTAEYRMDVSKVFTKRAILQAFNKCVEAKEN